MSALSPSMERFRNNYFATVIQNAYKMRNARKELKKIDEQKKKVKNIYASVIQDATNSALARLVELDGKQYVAKHFATEAPKVELKKTTLAQKLGLEERFKDGENNNLALNIENVRGKMPRLQKGSQEAKDFMARIRALRKGGPRAKKMKSLPLTGVAPAVASAPAKKRGRPPKVQQTYASVLAAPAPKRRGRKPKVAAPAPTVIPFQAIYNAKAKRRVGRPRVNKNPKPATEIAALLKRARFGLSRRYAGGRKK